MDNFIIQDPPNCLDDSDTESLSVDVALMKIISSIQPVTVSELVTLKNALNRTTSEDIIAPFNTPAFKTSAMDGYAINSCDIPLSGTTSLMVTGTSWAGKPYNDAVNIGSCVRIMTGAILPDGTDTIVIQENVRHSGDSVIIDSNISKGDNVRPIGESFAKGELLLKKGACLHPAALGLIASLGMREVSVIRKIRVAFFSTGDELREIGEPLQPGNIYDSNRYILFAMLLRLGIEPVDMGIVRDARTDIEKSLLTAAASSDAVIVSGGVSVGEADFTREILEKTGTLAFWKVAIKPGRPLVFGKIQHAWFFGLPGNPVSTMVTFYQLVQPALRQLMGGHPVESVMVRAVCASNLKKRPGRLEYQRGVLHKNSAGVFIVSKTGKQGSGVLTSMTQANCFIVLPVENEGVLAGETVEVQPFFGLV